METYRDGVYRRIEYITNRVKNEQIILAERFTNRIFHIRDENAKNAFTVQKKDSDGKRKKKYKTE